MTENEMILLSSEDTFDFSCTKHIPCFNECCRDLNQFLTPYDILRLKNRLNISSALFLERYTHQHTGPESGLPVVTFKTGADLKCPFVTPEGCSVYEDRPSSCRMYPLMRMISRSRETGRITEQFVLLKEEHCLGFGQDRKWTAKAWIKDQGLGPYNEMNDRLMEIIALKNQKHPGPLDIKSRHFFHISLYDLDAFRAQVFEKGILTDLHADIEISEAAKTDDTALLKLGVEWIKQTIFKG